ncbi:hypothetical protein D8I35_03640 [Corticibacter populi]|uniref:Uncharacterized protein n=1 Tax=Corticibacter populi TaxID=1550736 RepID=A0A3M6QYX0_9BURK|nr:hypothetical protein [Corticibacter populi]RMX08216.1 hypothetical protein D8I35_03640 [Corticibacter populi]RZS35484.1 hypothetical protein EV687_0552 [Corticibacter populi]
MPETYELACQRLGEMVELVDDLAAALDTVLLHQGYAMPASDRATRSDLVRRAHLLLKQIKHRG